MALRADSYVVAEAEATTHKARALRHGMKRCTHTGKIKCRFLTLFGMRIAGEYDRENMHELSIAMSIVEFAQGEAERRGSARVISVRLRLGAFSGVVKQALLSSYEMACADTCLVGSQLIVEEVPLVIYCATCDARRSVDPNRWFSCSVCGAPTPEIVGGRELEVTALELEE